MTCCTLLQKSAVAAEPVGRKEKCPPSAEANRFSSCFLSLPWATSRPHHINAFPFNFPQAWPLDS